MMPMTSAQWPPALAGWCAAHAGPPSRRYELTFETADGPQPLPVPRTEVRGACRQLLRRLRRHPPQGAWRLTLYDHFTRQVVRRWRSPTRVEPQAAAAPPGGPWAWLTQAARHANVHTLRQRAYAQAQERTWPRTPRSPAD